MNKSRTFKTPQEIADYAMDHFPEKGSIEAKKKVVVHYINEYVQHRIAEPELKDMSFSDLQALRQFALEHEKYYFDLSNTCITQSSISQASSQSAFWAHHKSIVQQAIDKKVAKYFGEEPKS